MRAPFFLLTLLFATAPALAQSNIGLTQYPAPKCESPAPVDPSLKPVPPPDPPSEGQAALYNSKVRAYNTAMRAHNEAMKSFGACIQTYVDAGDADIKRIQAAVDAAVAAANAQ